MSLTGRVRASFASIAERDYRLLWTGSLLATASFLTAFYLAPIVAYEVTGSYAASGFAQAGMIAQVVFGPISGVIADRYRKKPLLLGSQIIPAVIAIVTGILILSDNITVPLLFVSTFFFGVGLSLMGPARQAWIVELVPRQLLPNAIALQTMSINIATLLGPALLAILIVSAVAGAARSAVMLLNQTIMMSNTRQEYFGRVMSWIFVAVGLQGILAPIWGVVADAIGGRETLYVVGLVLVAGTVLMALSRARTRRIPPEPGTAVAAIEAEELAESESGGSIDEPPQAER